MKNPKLTFLVVMILLFGLFVPSRVLGWGDEGHRLVNRLAVERMPADVPAFFRKAAFRLAFLGPEPDRWRDTRQLYSALREQNGSDHFIDIDEPERFRALPNDRHQYSDWLRARGQDPKDVGFLPYSCMETWEKMQILFRYWRDPQNAAEREDVEQNIVYYAGVLGHFVADGANPLHTTIHYNGWSTTWNPERFTREPLHFRFESEFVKNRIRYADLEPMVRNASRLSDPFAEFMEYLLSSYRLVPRLYELEKSRRWDMSNESRESKRFVVERLGAGAQMLANLWYTAWVDSLSPPATRR